MAFLYQATIPILRSFDEVKAREFYVDWLGFSVDWEHRFAPGMPLYMQVSRDGILFHISEHSGDGSPGARVRVNCTGLRDLYAELCTRPYKNYRPEIEHPDWGWFELTVTDPFHNRVTFAERDQ